LSFSTAEIDLIPDIGPMFYSPWSTDYLMVHESPALISWCAYQPSKHISDLFSTELSKNGFVIEHDYKVGEFKVIAIDGVQLKKPINRTHAPLVQKEIKMEELRLIKSYQKELTDEVVPFIPVRPVAEIITAYLYHPTDK
jgi:hypothetical protein